MYEIPLLCAVLLDPDEIVTSPLAGACMYAVGKSGRQLRPRMVLAASQLGFASGEDVLAAMRTVELLHVASLLHDDVIDGSQLRRGESSVSHRYGALVAQYSGGWMLGAALQLASGLGQDAVELFAGVVGELCVGQMLETQHLWDRRRRQADYERAVIGKTASLFRLSVQLGGLVAGVNKISLKALDQFGLSFGIAYQLADDLSDLLSDPADTGKDPGTDVRHGVYTLPVIYALETDPGLLGDAVLETGAPSLDDVVGRVLGTDAVPRVISLCEKCLSDATAAVQDLHVPGLLKLIDEHRRSVGALR